MRWPPGSRAQYQSRQSDASERQQQRAEKMRRNDRRRPAVLLAQKQRDRFSGKGRKRGQAAEEPGRDREPPRDRQRFEMREESERDAHDEPADEIRGQRAERQRRQ